jgi:O-methyltransferase
VTKVSQQGADITHMSRLRRIPRHALGVVLKVPYLTKFLTDPEIGREYGVGFWDKLVLARKFFRNTHRVQTLSSVIEHLELAAAILRVPRSAPGKIVECGCYEGGSSVNLSLAAALTGRQLVICDSFQGLPAPDEADSTHTAVHTGWVDEYYEGRFAASLDLVKGNIERWGDLSACEFKVGFFDESLRDFDDDVVMAFLDVDLVASIQPCLTALWPKLQDGCRIYVHEANSLALVSIFFDKAWWGQAIGGAPPGFVGAGSGLPLVAPKGTVLGYAQKTAAPVALASAPAAA